MKAIPIIATVGRCGSSFVARCLEDLGVVVDPDMSWRDYAMAGREYGPVRVINDSIIGAITTKCPGGFCIVEHTYDLLSNESFVAHTAGIHKDDMVKAVEPLGCAKDPRFVMTLPFWLASGLVSRVVLLQRSSPQAVVASTLKNNAGLARTVQALYTMHGMATWVLGNASVPWDTLSYPALLEPETASGRRLVRVLADIAKRPQDDVRDVVNRLAHRGGA